MVIFERYYNFDSSVPVKVLELDGVVNVFTEEISNVIPHEPGGVLTEGLTASKSIAIVTFSVQCDPNSSIIPGDMRPLIMQWFDEWEGLDSKEYTTVITFRNSFDETYRVLTSSCLLDYAVPQNLDVAVKVALV